MTNTNNISLHLGSQSTYTDKYNPNLLVREERKLNREKYGINPKIC